MLFLQYYNKTLNHYLYYHYYLIARYGPGRQSRQQSLHKLGQLQQSITGWEGKDIVANCSEIVFEGKLKVSLTLLSHNN